MTHAEGDMRTVVVGGGEEVALPAGSAPTLAEKKKVTAKPKKVGCRAAPQ